MTLRHTLALLALAGLAGCENGLSPQLLSGHYSLVSLGNGPLTRFTDNACNAYTGGSLALQSGGTYYLSVQYWGSCPGGSVTCSSYLSYGQYGIHGRDLRLVPDSAGAAPIVAAWRGSHIFVPIPNVPGVDPDIVTAEFAPGGGGGDQVTTTGTTCFCSGCGIPADPTGRDTNIVEYPPLPRPAGSVSPI